MPFGLLVADANLLRVLRDNRGDARPAHGSSETISTAEIVTALAWLNRGYEFVLLWRLWRSRSAAAGHTRSTAGSGPNSSPGDGTLCAAPRLQGAKRFAQCPGCAGVSEISPPRGMH